MKGKNQEIKNLQARIKKLRNNVRANELGEFIIGRSKSPREIENQINRLAEKFNEIEENLDDSAIEKEGFYDIEELAGNLSKWRNQMKRFTQQERIRKRKKRRKKAEPLENKMDLSGKFGLSNLLRSNLEESNEVNAILRNEFPHQEDVKLYIQLPYYDDFRGYDLVLVNNWGKLQSEFPRISQTFLANIETPFICFQNTTKDI